MRIAIAHTTRLDYSEPVVEGVTDTRLGPHSDEHQRWLKHTLRAAPGGSANRYLDGFGNTAHLVTFARPHTQAEIVVRAEVETLLDNPFAPPAAPPAPLTPAELADSLAPTRLVPRAPELQAIVAPYRPRLAAEAFDVVRELAALIHRDFAYEPGTTAVTTTAPEVLRERSGVCQDFAHVLLGFCRELGIPARYVSGYIVARTADGSATRGSEASHAWVEAYTPTHGWRGFDPTNNLVASTAHVKMAIGRDYADVAPTRGAYRGHAEERLTVEVKVTPL